jgi:hypothetical protein
MFNKWVWIFLLVEMIWFNFEDALLLPFSSMQLRRSQMEPTGIQKILLAIYSLCSKVIHTPLMKILFSFEVLYQYYDLIVGTLTSIYNLMIYCFFVLTFTSIIKRLLLLLLHTTGLRQAVRWCRSTLLLYCSGKNQTA